LNSKKVQSIDAEKQKRAAGKGINLIVIPDLVSTKENVLRAFEEIKKIINQFIENPSRKRLLLW